jgi:hypothetical protein
MTNTELLQECKLQLEYLNEKFGETGTTNSLLSKLNQALHKPVVMQAEGSDGAEGAAVASEGQGEANTCAGGSKCVDIEIEEGYYQCEKCGRTSRG